jgi:hypothetical protein
MGEIRNEYKILAVKSDGKRPLEDLDLRKMVYEDGDRSQYVTLNKYERSRAVLTAC